MVVTPVVAYLDDVSVLEELRAAPGEVSRIFDHPLEALLDPGLAHEEGLVPLGSDDWPYEAELHVRRLCFVSPLALPPPPGSFAFPLLLYFSLVIVILFVWHISNVALIIEKPTEFYGCCVVGQHLSHAPFPEHCVASEGANGRHPGMSSPHCPPSFPHFPLHLIAQPVLVG